MSPHLYVSKVSVPSSDLYELTLCNLEHLGHVILLGNSSFSSSFPIVNMTLLAKDIGGAAGSRTPVQSGLFSLHPVDAKSRPI